MNRLKTISLTCHEVIFNSLMFFVMEAYLYILLCGNGSYYSGSTTDLDRRMEQHQLGEGANFTRKNLPVSLVYFEKFDRIDEAFEREKQIQGWSRAKKEALINRNIAELKTLSKKKK